MGHLHRSSSLPPSPSTHPKDDQILKYHRITFDDAEFDDDSDLFLSGVTFSTTAYFDDDPNVCWSFSDLAEAQFRFDQHQHQHHHQETTSTAIQTDAIVQIKSGPNLPDLSFLTPPPPKTKVIARSSPVEIQNPRSPHFEQPSSYPCLSSETRRELVLTISRAVDEISKLASTTPKSPRIEIVLKHEIAMSIRDLFKDGLSSTAATSEQNLLTQLIHESYHHHHTTNKQQLTKPEDHCDLFVGFVVHLTNTHQLSRWMSAKVLADHFLLQKFYTQKAFLRSPQAAQLRRQMLSDMGRLCRAYVAVYHHHQQQHQQPNGAIVGQSRIPIHVRRSSGKKSKTWTGMEPKK